MKNALELNQTQKLQQKLIPLQLQLGRLLELNDSAVKELVRTTVDENPALDYKFNDVQQEVDGVITTTQLVDDNVNSLGYESKDYSGRQDSALRNNFLENISEYVSGETLYEHLISQIRNLAIDPEVAAFAEFLIGNLDSNGFYTNSLQVLVDDYTLLTGIEPVKKVVDEAWELVRQLEPYGVGAKNLQDSLLIQTEHFLTGNTYPTSLIDNAQLLLSDYYNAVMKREMKQMELSSGLSAQEIKDAMDFISKLNPRPGKTFISSYSELANNYIIPDFAVLPDMEKPGELSISFVSGIPELQLEESFQEFSDEYLNKTKDRHNKSKQETALYLKERLDDAKNFLELLKMRQSTLLRIIKAIVKYQKEFFLTGDLHDLKPMVLRQLAEETGDDLSVLSRATSNRYVLTTGGIYSLKSLFNENVGSKGESNLTAIQIGAEIKRFIAEEDKEHPLSDEDLAEKLEGINIHVARRTIAKYRDNLEIPSARQRKMNYKNISQK